MCWCNPLIRTPHCGKPGCIPPVQTHGGWPMTMDEIAAAERPKPPPMSKWVPTTDLMTLRRMGKLAEELGELQAVTARVVIQGIDEVDPGTGKVNRQRLLDELADVQAQIGCTLLAFDLDQAYLQRRVAEKMRQMAEWESLFARAAGHSPKRDFLNALERVIESQKALATQLEQANPDDPYAGLMVHEDIELLQRGFEEMQAEA